MMICMKIIKIKQNLIKILDNDTIAHSYMFIGTKGIGKKEFAKEFAKTDAKEAFLNQLPHTYYEEDNLHAFLIEKIDDFEECADSVTKFLPFIDNWATCDSMSPKIFKKHKAELLCYIKNGFVNISIGGNFNHLFLFLFSFFCFRFSLTLQ